MLLQPGVFETDYKHEVISLNILVCVNSKNSLQIPRTTNNNSLVFPLFGFLFCIKICKFSLLISVSSMVFCLDACCVDCHNGVFWAPFFSVLGIFWSCHTDLNKNTYLFCIVFSKRLYPFWPLPETWVLALFYPLYSFIHLESIFYFLCDEP